MMTLPWCSLTGRNVVSRHSGVGIYPPLLTPPYPLTPPYLSSPSLHSQATHDVGLWKSLVAHAMQSSELIDALLDHICRGAPPPKRVVTALSNLVMATITPPLRQP